MTNTGWICPKCGNVYAPFIMQCNRCNTGGVMPNQLCDHTWMIAKDDVNYLICEKCHVKSPRPLEECNITNECKHDLDKVCNKCAANYHKILMSSLDECDHEFKQLYGGILEGKCQKCGAIE